MPDNSMKIDFVIPWVDGSDERWLAEKDQYSGVEGKIDSSEVRFRDWDNLKYFFRGVEKFAPWVNKVFFITCGQCPDWLNTNNEKLVPVDHKDYIPEKYLPTFSSHPIELNMHRIKELSETFVYFNDDLFLTSDVKETDFFRNGLPCDSFVEDPVTFTTKDVMADVVVNDLVTVNNRFSRKEVLKKNRSKVYSLKDKKGVVKNFLMSFFVRDAFTGLEFSHISQPFLKSEFDKVWEDNYELLDNTSSHKLRSSEDVNAWLVKFYQLLEGKFTPFNWRGIAHAYQLVDEGDAANIDEACRAIREQKLKILCLNDSNVNHFEDTKNKINSALDSILPEKCSFEL